jgi:hypothetical protein
MKRSALRFIVIVLAATAATSCTSIGVKPWQRDLLASSAMQLDAHPVDDAIDDHIYFSKEASSGGRGFGGGGCGCN